MKFKIGDKVRYYFGKGHEYNKRGKWYVQNDGEVACGKHEKNNAYAVLWRNVPTERLDFFKEIDGDERGNFVCVGNTLIVKLMETVLSTEPDMILEEL